jgi:hypothetical protein
MGWTTVTSAENWVDKALDVTRMSNLKLLGGRLELGGGEINTSWRAESPVDLIIDVRASRSALCLWMIPPL